MHCHSVQVQLLHHQLGVTKRNNASNRKELLVALDQMTITERAGT